MYRDWRGREEQREWSKSYCSKVKKMALGTKVVVDKTLDEDRVYILH